jgi:predicted Zn-dependent protease with MMP-like domain
MSEHLGIRFIYNLDTPSTDIPESTEEKPLEELAPEALAFMPQDWLANLHQAAICADSELVLNLLNDLPDEHQPLRLALIDLVDNFSFEEIVSLTKNRN